jgi:hypothetical protein
LGLSSPPAKVLHTGPVAVEQDDAAVVDDGGKVGGAHEAYSRAMAPYMLSNHMFTTMLPNHMFTAGCVVARVAG